MCEMPKKRVKTTHLSRLERCCVVAVGPFLNIIDVVRIRTCNQLLCAQFAKISQTNVQQSIALLLDANLKAYEYLQDVWMRQQKIYYNPHADREANKIRQRLTQIFFVKDVAAWQKAKIPRVWKTFCLLLKQFNHTFERKIFTRKKCNYKNIISDQNPWKLVKFIAEENTGFSYDDFIVFSIFAVLSHEIAEGVQNLICMWAFHQIKHKQSSSQPIINILNYVCDILAKVPNDYTRFWTSVLDNPKIAKRIQVNCIAVIK